jgi:hypothetical protein
MARLFAIGVLLAVSYAYVADRAYADAQARNTDRWDQLYVELAEECHPAQQAFVTDPSPRLAVLCGGRAGKTTGMRARAIRRAVGTPKARVLFVASTGDQCRDIFWDPLKDINERYDLGMVFNETRLRAFCPWNRSWLRLFGMDNMREINKLRGIAWHEVLIDECGAYPPQLLEHFYERVIEPRLDDYPDTSLTIGGTPGHILRGPFYDATRTGGNETDEFSVHAWSLSDCKDEGPKDWQIHANRVWAKALEKKAKKGWSDSHPVWRREYLGIWAADDTEMVFRYRPHDEAGAEFNMWDPPREGGIVKLPAGDWEYVYAMDEGYKDPFALNIFAFNRHDGELLHVYGYEQTGMHARPIAQLLLGEKHDAANPSGLIGATGWPSAFVGDIGEGLQLELRNTYGIAVARVDKRPGYKHDAIELTNGDFLDGRIKVLKGSALHKQLQELQWSVDDYGFLKENKGQANHSTDCLIGARQAAFHQFQVPREAPEVVRTETEKANAWEAESKAKLLSKGQEQDFTSMLAAADWGGDGEW